jgi:putative membrane protein
MTGEPNGARATRKRLPCGLAAFLSSCLLAGAAAAQPMSAQDFVNAAARSDAYEIAASQLILAQSRDQAVRGFAQQMIEDHRRTSSELAAAAAAAKLDPPAMIVGGDQQRMLSALQSQKGADLDRSYVTQQVNAHTAALVTEQGYLASGNEPSLRKAAQGPVPLIEHHLAMVKRMSATLPAT